MDDDDDMPTDEGTLVLVPLEGLLPSLDPEVDATSGSISMIQLCNKSSDYSDS